MIKREESTFTHQLQKELRILNANMTRPSGVLMRQTLMKKAQVVYYLSRNGHLEHPHYMELTLHLAHQHPTLKDVMERLTVLRGKGMPCLYSWSCKRSYKNGYVWNDLSENDEIFPSEGGEYVLKGSEIIFDKLQHLQLNPDSTLHPKRKLLPSKRHPHRPQQIANDRYREDEEEYEEKQQTCSRGVSTDEIEDFSHHNGRKVPQVQHTIDAHSPPPPSTAASGRSDISSNTLDAAKSNYNSTRFEDGDPVGIDPMLSRNSMLLSLIACGGGGSSSFRRSFAPARKSCSESLHKPEATAAEDDDDDDEMMVKYMSENPRLIGKLRAEEKEYFSGSIVDAMGDEEEKLGREQRPGLKRSSSFNQERSGKMETGEAAAAAEKAEVKRDKGKMKGKCIPRKKSCSSSKK